MEWEFVRSDRGLERPCWSLLGNYGSDVEELIKSDAGSSCCTSLVWVSPGCSTAGTPRIEERESHFGSAEYLDIYSREYNVPAEET